MTLLAVGGSNGALGTFVLYTVGVFVLAAAANRLLREKSFLSEYFLGSRSLGMWAFALTFAATSSSGGSFIGFPALIYTHGWILALWIGSYMVVPICTMGLIGKRVNQVARISGAITMPDVLRDRYESRGIGLLSTLLITFFLVFNLVAQFKGGSLILKTLLSDVELFQASSTWLGERLPDWWIFTDGAGQPVDPAYLLCLLAFGVTVVFYTTYGGFHAVVWTDVMQGVVMVFGVLILLPLALWKVGGLETATRDLARLTPPRAVELRLRAPDNLGQLPAGTVLAWVDPQDGATRVFRFPRETPLDTRASDRADAPLVVRALEHTSETEVAQLAPQADAAPGVEIVGAEVTQEFSYVTGPGPNRADVDGFLPLGVAISFFFMWAISGSGQPQYMVRLMAFKNSQTLRRAIITVTIYYTLIYFPLVVIFVCARSLLPGLEEPDRIMPEMSVFLTQQAGVGWLAGLLVAAPFAAVMSSVDSFLLVISSAVVRDVYQRNINPHASERTVKWMSYVCTLSVGVIATLGAINPPRFLQDIIVYVGSGLAACFLFPVVATLYWRRANVAGCLAGMLAGFATHLGMHMAGMWVNGSFVKAYRVFGLHPVVVGLFASMAAVLIVTPLTPRPEERLVQRYFYRRALPGR